VLWWLRQRGALTFLPGALLVFALGASATHGLTVAFPAYLGNYTVATELSNFVTLVPSISLVACLESRMPSVERSAVRRLETRDTMLVSGCALAATAVAAGVSLSGPEAMLTAARNNLLFCGLALAAWPLLGHRASLFPVFWMIHALFLGGRRRDDPYPWVIVTEPAHSSHALLGAVAAFLAGLLSLIFCAPRTSR
jgi:hypothetical protein